jgi:hypothetical protein
MTPTCPKCGGTDLRLIQNPVHGLFVFCNTMGCHTFPVPINIKPVMKEPARIVKFKSGYYGVSCSMSSLSHWLTKATWDTQR